MVIDAENETLAWLKARYQGGVVWFGMNDLHAALPNDLKPFTTVVISALIDRAIIRPAQPNDLALMGMWAGGISFQARVFAAMRTPFLRNPDGGLQRDSRGFPVRQTPSAYEGQLAENAAITNKLVGRYMIDRCILEMKTDDYTPPTLTTNQVAAKLGRDEKTVREWAKNEWGDPVHRGKGRAPTEWLKTTVIESLLKHHRCTQQDIAGGFPSHKKRRAKAR